ncbi:hypothetical protein QL285_026049 [Trifolium repens]|nr:hypothetical protein QL285_026049 [Trifolium repens]
MNENNMKIVLSSIGCSNESKFDDGDYESEELHSSDPDASDEEICVRYEKFINEQMGKKYKFKYGMKFTSLAEFREAIRDHNVRNGYEIKYVKNEGDMVRVAKQYASAIIEGDADRQYSMLRRYADELVRVNKGNTVKIGVDRPIPSIHPRPRKLRIRATGEEGARKRRRGVVYHCTKCNNTSHNAASCKATEQDSNNLKRKRKNAKGKGKVKNESKETTQTPTAGTDAPKGSQNGANHQTPPGRADAPEASQTQAPDAVEASQVSMVVEPSQDLFDDIPDEVIATLPEVDLPKNNEPTNDNGKKVNGKTEKVKKVFELYHGKPRRSSERVKQNSFKKPITGVGAK